VHIAICDSNMSYREQLMQAIRASLAEESISYRIREYAHLQELVYDVQDGERVDAVFADVGDAESRQGLSQWRFDCFEGFLILTSDCERYAMLGYTLEADGYLLKPFSVSHVKEGLTRLCKRAGKACLTVMDRSHIIRIPYHDILYIESRNARCIIHRLHHADYTLYTHLDDLQKELRDKRFLRCHQSYLVNMDQVVSADTQFVMSNGDAVSIRQRERKLLRDCFGAYIRSKESENNL